MEQFNTVDLRIKGFEDVTEFAKGILILCNLKSSVKESVIDFSTFEGSNLIAVKVYREFYNANKSYLESYVGEITHEMSQVMYGIEYEDINPAITKDMDEQLDRWLDDEKEVEPEPFAHLLYK